MSSWNCPKCAAEVNEGFDVCWQCGTASDGTVATEFVPEVDVATLPANHVRTIQCDGCGYRGKILTGRYSYGRWAFVLTPILVLSFFGLIPLFLWFHVTELLRFKQCPRCRDGTRIHDWVGDIPAENETLWAEAQADETRRFQQSRLRLLWLILGTLALPAAATLAAWLVSRLGS